MLLLVSRDTNSFPHASGLGIYGLYMVCTAQSSSVGLMRLLLGATDHHFRTLGLSVLKIQAFGIDWGEWNQLNQRIQTHAQNSFS